MAFALCLSTAAPAQVIEPKKNGSLSDLDEAKKAMAAGVALVTDPDGARYEEAYPHFKKAYRLSGSMNALQNLAICAMKMELDGEAIAYFKTVLAQKKTITKEERAEVEKDIARLEATLAWVTLDADTTATVIDVRLPNRGAPVRNRYKLTAEPLKIGVRPGNHTFTATNDDGTVATWKVDIANGTSHSHTFAFDGSQAGAAVGLSEGTTTTPSDGGAAGEGGSSVPTAVWVVGGLTVASGVAFGALAGVASGKRSTYENDVLRQDPLEEQQAAYDDLNTFNLVADVMLGVTIAGAATTLVLALALPWEDEEGTASTDGGPRFGRDFTVGPSLDPRGGGGLVLNARF